MVKPENRKPDPARLAALKKRPGRKKTGRPKGSAKFSDMTERLYVRLTPDMAAKVKEDAAKNHRSASAHLAFIVDLYYGGQQ